MKAPLMMIMCKGIMPPGVMRAAVHIGFVTIERSTWYHAN